MIADDLRTLAQSIRSGVDPSLTYQQVHFNALILWADRLAALADQIQREEQEQKAARDLFWPHDNDVDGHIYEIRNGRNADYVRAHAMALAEIRRRELAEAKADTAEQALAEWKEKHERA